jgi:hypothetical protein
MMLHPCGRLVPALLAWDHPSSDATCRPMSRHQTTSLLRSTTHRSMMHPTSVPSMSHHLTSLSLTSPPPTRLPTAPPPVATTQCVWATPSVRCATSQPDVASSASQHATPVSPHVTATRHRNDASKAAAATRDAPLPPATAEQARCHAATRVPTLVSPA